VLAGRIDNAWAKIGLYGIATLTALERVHDNQHWGSDVIAGAGFGLLGGFYVLGKERERENAVSEPSGRLQIQPSLTGVSMSYRIY
jgi:membrane-associated phospholipid phosphatase